MTRTPAPEHLRREQRDQKDRGPPERRCVAKSWWEGERAFGAGAVAMEPVRWPVQWGEHGDRSECLLFTAKACLHWGGSSLMQGRCYTPQGVLLGHWPLACLLWGNGIWVGVTALALACGS